MNKQVLYSAARIETDFTESSSGSAKTLSGTAFYCQIKNSLILVTNRHLLDISYRQDKYMGFKLSSLRLIGRMSDDKLTRASAVSPIQVIYHQNSDNDVAIIRCKNLNLISDGDLRIENFIPENIVAKTKDFDDEIEICDFVAFPGYPVWYDKVEDRPIMRVGTIASDPSKSYHFGSGYNAMRGNCIAYEAFSYGGSSGSPVFALQKGLRPGMGITFEAFRTAKFIGINAGHLSSTDLPHSGLSYFFRSSILFDMV